MKPRPELYALQATVSVIVLDTQDHPTSHIT
jgi:hypothetical protein